jgi:hypothetical protein
MSGAGAGGAAGVSIVMSVSVPVSGALAGQSMNAMTPITRMARMMPTRMPVLLLSLTGSL